MLDEGLVQLVRVQVELLRGRARCAVKRAASRLCLELHARPANEPCESARLECLERAATQLTSGNRCSHEVASGSRDDYEPETCGHANQGTHAR